MSPENAPPPDSSGSNRSGGREAGWPRWTLWILIAVVAGLLLLPNLFSSEDREGISYGQFLEELKSDQVSEASFNNESGKVTGELVNKEMEGFKDFSVGGIIPNITFGPLIRISPSAPTISMLMNGCQMKNLLAIAQLQIANLLPATQVQAIAGSNVSAIHQVLIPHLNSEY